MGRGGSTVQGSIATGMGNFAAGAGAYNVQTAQARSMNAQTAMQWNDYMYAINQRNAANEVARRRRQQETNETADATYKRLHDNPDPRDIHTGDALNVVLTELANPKVYTQVVQKSTTPIDSQLVKNINFQYAANMILISLEDISARGVPDVLATNPGFESRPTGDPRPRREGEEGGPELEPGLARDAPELPRGGQGRAGQGRRQLRPGDPPAGRGRQLPEGPLRAVEDAGTAPGRAVPQGPEPVSDRRPWGT